MLSRTLSKTDKSQLAPFSLFWHQHTYGSDLVTFSSFFHHKDSEHTLELVKANDGIKVRYPPGGLISGISVPRNGPSSLRRYSQSSLRERLASMVAPLDPSISTSFLSSFRALFSCSLLTFYHEQIRRVVSPPARFAQRIIRRLQRRRRRQKDQPESESTI